MNVMLYPYSYPGILKSVGYRVHTPAFTLLLGSFPSTQRPGTGMGCCTLTPTMVARAYRTGMHAIR